MFVLTLVEKQLTARIERSGTTAAQLLVCSPGRFATQAQSTIGIAFAATIVANHSTDTQINRDSVRFLIRPFPFPIIGALCSRSAF
jgi:hypothetical protein